MTETQVITIAVAIIGGLFTVLTGLIAWIGGKALSRLDEMVSQLSSVKTELHDRIHGIDNRVIKLETQVQGVSSFYPSYKHKG